ncbi:hypothetical protein L6452_05547 [Arctium lappa]|uniref:Uncharacterized protein n=1 Tax=Arctium lappa TaxID=4217 RepID=A0ACB9EH04_ARCLA|nr:hypothetical protein L6452_05547 [Arctium lappa]
MMIVQKVVAENVEGNETDTVDRVQTEDAEGEAETTTHVEDVRIHIEDLSIDDTTPIFDTIQTKDVEPEIETATQVNTIQTEDMPQKTAANDEDVSMQSTMVIVQSIMSGDVQTDLETDTQIFENENVIQTSSMPSFSLGLTQQFGEDIPTTGEVMTGEVVTEQHMTEKAVTGDVVTGEVVTKQHMTEKI